MSVIINIDTATDIAHVSIAKDGFVLQQTFNHDQKDHAGFLQVTIKQLLINAGLSFPKIDAVAITSGPGSYTGLRVGMASAKGLCYVLQKPLICLGTLEVLAKSAIDKIDFQSISPFPLFCPMIDARRMEVFTAIYDNFLKTILSPRALIVETESFSGFLKEQQMIFVGNGSIKWQKICNNSNAIFYTIDINPLSMSTLAMEKYMKKDFAALAYSEPEYLKDFYTYPIQS